MEDPGMLFRGKRITVMGLGLLGRGLGDALFFIRCGAEVTVTDLKTPEELAPSLEKLKGLPCRLRLGEHHPDDFVNTDMVLRNADVPKSSKFLKLARDNGIPVEMDESLFCRHFPGRVVGITGTRGKTTTTMIIHGILSAYLPGRVHLGGNVMGLATLPLLETAAPMDTVVLELSSWQLQGFHDAKLSPAASVFTNIHPDHLNRYSGMEEYIDDKKAVYRYQKNGDFCLFNGEQPETAMLAEEAPGEAAFFSSDLIPPDWMITLPGRHNRENVAAALGLTRRLGVPDASARSFVEKFRGVEHRLQWLGDKDGIGFVNDSTSTTPVAGCMALEAFGHRTILLIAGGADKKLDLTPFARAAAASARRIALLEGTAAESLYGSLVREGAEEKITGRYTDLEKAVKDLLKEAVPGDVVLLTPGCASFGMFRNEYDRGDQFMAIVQGLLGKRA
ncbi:MAG: UDP-N-acetylmuramoyl-L-alanine--D-glutamate ligase [Pseudomonadota bacterium]